jgi:hypothetical protein
MRLNQCDAYLTESSIQRSILLRNTASNLGSLLYLTIHPLKEATSLRKLEKSPHHHRTHFPRRIKKCSRFLNCLPMCASPSKSTPRKIATPRKRRTKAQKLAEAEEAAAAENGTTASASVEPTPSVTSEAPASEAPVSEAPAPEAPADDVVKVVVDEVVKHAVDAETVHTTVKVQMPSSHPNLQIPDTAEGILEQARAMVEEGRKLEAEKGKSLKRKADEVEDAEEPESSVVQQAKKVKTESAIEKTIKRERVNGRALFGIATALAVG